MNKSIETLPQSDSNARIQQLVQHLAEDYQSRNYQESRELYENIAQSLVAIKTQISLLEKRLPRGQVEISEQILDLDLILKTALGQLRVLADGIHSNTLANLGLKAAIQELCRNYSAKTRITVSFECAPTGDHGLTHHRQTAICLNYFVEQSLIYAGAKTSGPIKVILRNETDGVTVTLHFTQCDQPETAEGEKIMMILEEWLNVWGGKMQNLVFSNNTILLRAWMGKGI